MLLIDFCNNKIVRKGSARNLTDIDFDGMEVME